MLYPGDQTYWDHQFLLAKYSADRSFSITDIEELHLITKVRPWLSSSCLCIGWSILWQVLRLSRILQDGDTRVKTLFSNLCSYYGSTWRPGTSSTRWVADCKRIVAIIHCQKAVDLTTQKHGACLGQHAISKLEWTLLGELRELLDVSIHASLGRILYWLWPRHSSRLHSVLRVSNMCRYSIFLAYLMHSWPSWGILPNLAYHSTTPRRTLRCVGSLSCAVTTMINRMIITSECVYVGVSTSYKSPLLTCLS